MAVAEIAEPTNARRDICDLLVMLSSSELLNIETLAASDIPSELVRGLGRVRVHVPPEIASGSFMDGGSDGRKVSGDVMFETVLANIAEQLL